jgi:hypothetical protein
MHRSPLPPQETELVRSLLAAAGAETVPQGSRERVAQRLGVRPRSQVPSDAARPSIEPPAVAPTRAGAWSKAALLGVVGGSCIGALWISGLALQPVPRVIAPMVAASASSAHASNAVPSVEAAEVGLPALSCRGATLAAPLTHDAPAAARAVPLGVDVPGKRRAAHARKSTSTPAAHTAGATAPGLLAEVRALDRVRHALHGGRPALALTGLDDYASEFPRGELALEAAVLRVQALLASARGDEARALARRTLAASGSERYRPALEHVLTAAR